MLIYPHMSDKYLLCSHYQYATARCNVDGTRYGKKIGGHCDIDGALYSDFMQIAKHLAD